MVKVNWSEQALDDLDDIGEYIAKDSVRYAQITVKELFDSTYILETNLKAGRVVPEFDENDIREIIKGNYRIVYKIIDKTNIDVLTVHHSKRLLSHNPVFKNK